jgi:hypothetical protein
LHYSFSSFVAKRIVLVGQSEKQLDLFHQPDATPQFHGGKGLISGQVGFRIVLADMGFEAVIPVPDACNVFLELRHYTYIVAATPVPAKVTGKQRCR